MLLSCVASHIVHDEHVILQHQTKPRTETGNLMVTPQLHQRLQTNLLRLLLTAVVLVSCSSYKNMILISCHLNFKLTTYTDVLMHIHTTDDDIFAAEEVFSLFPILKMF